MRDPPARAGMDAGSATRCTDQAGFRLNAVEALRLRHRLLCLSALQASQAPQAPHEFASRRTPVMPPDPTIEDALALPFPAFLLAVEGWLDSLEQELGCEPHEEQLFQFVRALRGHPHLRGVPPEQAHRTLVEHVRKHGGPAYIADFGLEYEDGEVAFHDMWERVRFPIGADPVEVACSLAGEGSIQTNRKRPGKYVRFLTVAALLQIQVRQRPILLPVRKLAQHLPCEPNTVSSWTRWAVQDEVLVKVREHSFRSAGGSRAAEYVLGLHLWQKVLPKLGALTGIAVRPEDLTWIEQEFAAARGTQAS